MGFPIYEGQYKYSLSFIIRIYISIPRPRYPLFYQVVILPQ